MTMTPFAGAGPYRLSGNPKQRVARNLVISFLASMRGMVDVKPVRVPADFEREFPGASRSAAEVAPNLVQASDAFLAELHRRRREIADLSPIAFQPLSI